MSLSLPRASFQLKLKCCADYTLNLFKFAQCLYASNYIVGKSSVLISSPVLLLYVIFKLLTYDIYSF